MKNVLEEYGEAILLAVLGGGILGILGMVLELASSH